MSWIKDFLTKAGLEPIANLYSNSPDKLPEDFDIDKTIADYRADQLSIFKATPEYKQELANQKIITQKEINKAINKAYNLGLTGEEAAKTDFDKLIEMVNEGHKKAIEESRNGKTTEWQEKYNTSIAETQKFKDLLEKTETEYKKKIEDLQNSNKKIEEEIILKTVFNECFDKLDWGKDDMVQVRKDNGKIIMDALIKERGIKWHKDGTVYTGENDAVVAPDGVTRIKNLAELQNSIGKEKSLFPQANPGNKGGNGGKIEFTKTGDPAMDAYAQAEAARLASLNPHLQ